MGVQPLKISPLVLLLAGALVGALAWGTCSSGRASEAERQLRDAQAALADSSAHWKPIRDSLVSNLHALRTDATRLSVALTRTQASRDAAQRDAQSLATRLQAAGDTAGARIVLVADSTATAERLGCSLVVINCEARAANAEQRVAGDSVILAQTQALLITVEAAWERERRQNQPGFLGLRAFWKARAYTVPLAALSAILILRK